MFAHAGAWAGFLLLLRVALPLARPAIAGGTALALMEVVADFGTVHHFAVDTFTTGIYGTWFAMGDRGAASQLAVCLMGVVGLLLLLEHLSRGGRRFHPTTTRHPPFRPVRLAGWKAAGAFALCLAPIALGFLLPAGALLWLALTVGDPLAPHRFLPFAVNSLMLATITAALAVGLAALLAWGGRLAPSPATRIATRIAMLGYAVARVGHRRRHAGALRDVRQRPRSPGCAPPSVSPLGCCCRAPWWRWCSPILCVSWPLPSRRWMPGWRG